MHIRKVVLWSVIIAFGGFLFGLDTAVMSGAEQEIQKLWQLNIVEHGLTVSMALIGTVIGAMVGGLPTEKLGRKKTLFWIAILFLISALGSALAIDWYTFLFFRFLGGLAVGCSSVTAPMYIGELAPASHRGRLVAMFQVNVVIGILIAFLSNYILADAGQQAWRWMLGIQAFPSLFFVIAIIFLPESPRWLIVVKSDLEGAERILTQVNASTARAEVQQIANAHLASSQQHGQSLFAKQNQWPLLLAFLMAFFNQVSGINAIIYYAPRIFEMAGLGKQSALLSTAGIGLINLIFTLLALVFIDRFGRRKLMIVGSIGLIITLGLVAKCFYLSNFSSIEIPIYLFLFIAFFAISQGAVVWVFISEIFPNEVRAKGQSFGSFTHWLLASIIAFSFPYVSERLGGGNSFLIFTIMMVLQLIFVIRLMPETKGKSLEERTLSNTKESNIETLPVKI